MNKSYTRAKYSLIGGVLLTAGGTFYYFYARVKSKELQNAIDYEIKTGKELFNRTCVVLATLSKYYRSVNRMVNMAERFPVLTQACRNADLAMAADQMN